MGLYLKKLRFSRAQKIKSKNEISRLFKEGRRWESVGFALIYGQNDLRHDRLGVVVSRKLGNAVERNRIKRVFREVYRCNIKNNPPFFDILIKPRSNISVESLDFNELARSFNKWQNEVKYRE